LNEHITLDIAYMAVLGPEKTSTYVPLPGTYKDGANVASINVGYSF
jgi:hypothetical protein